MNDISKQNIKTLVKLQEAETQIVRLKSVLEKVKKEKEKLSGQLKQFGNALEENKENLLSDRTACKDIEREIQVVDDRIIKSNEKLRMVKTNKEYQLFLREVDDNKKRKDALETELLEYLDEKEKTEAIVQESEKEYHLLKDQIEGEQKDIEKKSTDDRELLDEYLTRQKEIGKNLDPSLMTRFVKISKMNKGSAVVNVKNEVCMGCFMNIPPQLYIEVQRGNSLISCPQCSRILYYINT
ncbi:C4-type zinc ribbon domain-containing protein [Desulfobacula sp.]|uniref:zinc ribbon domain-containing protein n=1 Tax=Desulfobacula sp. TaxID=2593537 RepID=UPI0025C1DFAC|nr:C4-type zinc ribbon domain-containing protein [Desulfobacula sp.]MBC2705510.1 nucleotide-binding protein [Desulfobacula sp.]